jgi:tryptophan synthase beta chain
MTGVGRFGAFGGQYVPEVLMPALIELDRFYAQTKDDSGFLSELTWYNRHYGGRPTPLYYARRLSERAGGAKIYLKREDLCHGGAHKFNNVMGQGLLCKRMGKTRVIAETGAGQHGTATAMAAAVLGLKAEVYMGAKDMARQRMNVFRMKLMGAEVHEVDSGSCTLKDAINEAMRDWAASVEDTYYLFGTAAGPHPYPTIVRDFQSIIGREIEDQLMAQEGRRPDLLVACVGGGSNAIGTFYPFIQDDAVHFLGAEAAGCGLESGRHSATLCAGLPGVLHGAASYLLQNEHGMVKETHSVAAGLDYPGVGPEHSCLKDMGRAEYVGVTDEECLRAFDLLSRTEGIIPALESAHAVHAGFQRARAMTRDEIVVITVSGRGDKDLETVMAAREGAA